MHEYAEEPSQADKEDDGGEESADEDCLIKDKQLLFNPTS